MSAIIKYIKQGGIHLKNKKVMLISGLQIIFYQNFINLHLAIVEGNKKEFIFF